MHLHHLEALEVFLLCSHIQLLLSGKQIHFSGYMCILVVLVYCADDEEMELQLLDSISKRWSYNF